jgi:hypothetical protein
MKTMTQQNLLEKEWKNSDKLFNNIKNLTILAV